MVKMTVLPDDTNTDDDENKINDTDGIAFCLSKNGVRKWEYALKIIDVSGQGCRRMDLDDTRKRQCGF